MAQHPPTESAGLWSPGYRSLTIGLVLTITLVASEALAVSTIMPIVAEDLAGGDRTLYGWVFSSFILASLVGIAAAGVMIDRGSLTRPYLLGLGLFSVGLVVGGLAPSMPVLVAGRVLQGLGAGAIPAVAYVAIGRALPERLRAADVRHDVDGLGPARRARAVHRRPRRGGLPLAARVPGAAAADRDRGGHGGAGDQGDPGLDRRRQRARRRDRRPAAPAARPDPDARRRADDRRPHRREPLAGHPADRRRAGDRDPGLRPADAAGHAPGRPRAAGGGPAPGHPDVRVLLRRRLRRARVPGVARHDRDRGRDRPDRRDAVVDVGARGSRPG